MKKTKAKRKKRRRRRWLISILLIQTLKPLLQRFRPASKDIKPGRK